MGGGIGAVGYIIVGGAGFMVGWHAGVPWQFVNTNCQNESLFSEVCFLNTVKLPYKIHDIKSFFYFDLKISDEGAPFYSNIKSTDII